MTELAFLLRVLFGAVLRAFFPAVFAEAKESVRDTAENATPQTALKNRLSQRARAKWGRQALAGGAMLAMCVVLAGCGTRTVYVPDGEPVRLREPIRNAAVWVMGADGQPVASTMTIPAGWYALPDPGDSPAPESPPTASTTSVLGITTDAGIPIVTATPAIVTR